MEFDELFCLMTMACMVLLSITLLWMVIPPTMSDDLKHPERLIRVGVGILIGAILTSVYDHFPAILRLTCWKM